MLPFYQVGLSAAAPGTSPSYRNIPDVAMLAANAYVVVTNCDVGNDAGYCPPGQIDSGIQEGIDGTSIATPLWAGFTALMNQYAHENGSQPVGFINPTVYHIGLNPDHTEYVQSFHDITDGGASTNACGFGYMPQPGYDLVTGWGSPQCGLITTVVSDVRPVSVGGSTACAVTTTGGVDCWGNNGSGQLGNGTTNDSSSPSPVVTAPGVALDNVFAVSVANDFACAVTTNGAVYCWGDDSYGELGDNWNSGEGYFECGVSDMPLPPFRCSKYAVPVAGLGSGVVSVSVGGAAACALTTSGAVLCWGDDSLGQLGDGQALSSSVCAPAGQAPTADLCSPVPIPVQVLDTPSADAGSTTQTGFVTSLSLGTYSACAATSAGSLFCWGDNSYGEGGQPAGEEANAPTAVADVSDAQLVSVGDYFACYLSVGGTVSCWGIDIINEATPPQFSYAPRPVSGIGTAMAVFAGGASVCAAPTAGENLVCWGNNSFGQLGNGTRMGGAPSPVSNLTFTPFEVSVNRSSAAAIGTYFACGHDATGTLYCWGDNSDGELGQGTEGNPVEVPVSVSLQ